MSTDTSTDPVARRDDAGGQVSYAIFDQALWTRFSEAGSVEEFVDAWLALLCRNLSGAIAAVTVLGDPDTGPFTPKARWPEDGAIGPELMAATERALGTRQPMLTRSEGQHQVALPLLIDGTLYGAVAVSVAIAPDATPPGEAIRHLRWGGGWIEVLLRRDQGQAFEALQTRTATALEMLATVLEQKRFNAAASALVTDLARALDCDPVSVGVVRRGGARVVALSHAAGFGKRMSLLRDIRAAMNEAIDQEEVVLWPTAPGWDYRVTLAHEELVRTHKADSVLSVPIQHEGRLVGALTLEKSGPHGFSPDQVELVDAVATMVGPVLEEKRRNDRILIVKVFEVIGNQLKSLLGPRHFGRKLATLIVAGLVWYFATATATFTIAAPAELQGKVQRTVVAPFNGYLADEEIQAGAIVTEDQVLARLDDRDLVLERLRLSTSRGQRQAEYAQALAARERAEANIIESQMRQIDSQIALVDEQIARTEIRAPFDGMVVSGDLSQKIGATIERGQELFRIAPLEGWRVVLEVDERDLAEVAPGQTGQLRVSSLPDVPLGYTVERITPVSDQREGRNFFRVDAALDETDPRLRPSMEGVARTRVDERLLIAIWMRPVIDWAKLFVWRWSP
ncbi:HlyD family efflux transporter periplasmic adaptor subunit [Maribius pontilimi]|uniref:HlyD family efflux transporter periplasmic adaptor subunit n=1 Tax=Palleronia pontilimi TaxID=1964209 RepID=A0A934I7R1_9RHOB|nr:HlyD family efflux transporter periplasmic adaptor subunit [Palleronia pontilimi]MBJ3761994.1 HlyD family efflux transporter periplasmic adaptor subunit [Palleronia pontilimi]